MDEDWAMSGLRVISAWYRFARFIRLRGGILCMSETARSMSSWNGTLALLPPPPFFGLPDGDAGPPEPDTRLPLPSSS
jgi:hypothetical protein